MLLFGYISGEQKLPDLNASYSQVQNQNLTEYNFDLNSNKCEQTCQRAV